MARRLIALTLLLGCPLASLADEEQKLEREKVIELLGNLLPRAVPSAQVEVVPGKGNTIILRGWACMEDAETLIHVARTVWGPSAGEIVNALRDTAPRIQLDLSILRINRDLLLRQEDVAALAESRSLSATECQHLREMLQTFVEEEQGSLWTETVLSALSGQPAQHSTGGECAVPQVSGFGGESAYLPTGFKDHLPPGIRLHFLPTLMADGQVHLEFKPEGLKLAQPFTPLALTLAQGGGALLVLPNVTWELKPKAEDLIVLVMVKMERELVKDDFEFFLDGIIEAPRGKDAEEFDLLEQYR